MVYHIAVVDDLPADAALLSALVGRWAGSTGREARCEAFPSAEAFLFRYAEDKRFDILLLDVEMGGMSGVQLAKAVRAQSREMQIVFVTGYADYLADGYDVEALHCLIKPVREEKLRSVLERAAQKLKEAERALLIEAGGEAVRLPLSEITHIEVQRNYVTVHAREGAYTLRATLSDMQAQLDGRFFRMGRSFIVNLHAVRRVTREQVLLQGGAALPLARGMYAPLNRAIIERC